MNMNMFLESDSDSVEDADNEGGLYYSIYESRHRQKHRSSQNAESSRQSNRYGQSQATITISVGQGVFSMFTPVRVRAINCYFCFIIQVQKALERKEKAIS